jgi:hypothetical protein
MNGRSLTWFMVAPGAFALRVAVGATGLRLQLTIERSTQPTTIAPPYIPHRIRHLLCR